jgi:hypothetical protein
MAQFLKPSNLNNVWASGGDRIYPGDTKYATGWQVEIPPRQYFNEIDYKQDQMLAHLNQHGIPVWDSETEYQANQSYVQGSTGTVYRCVQTHTSQNPELDTVGTYWKVAFLTPENVPSYGSNYIRHPNNLVDQWSSAEGVVPSSVGSLVDVTVVYPVPLVSVLDVQVTNDLGSPTEAGEVTWGVYSKTTSQVVVRFVRTSGSNSAGNERVRANVRILGIAPDA